jgi:hypothetical protein
MPNSRTSAVYLPVWEASLGSFLASNASIRFSISCVSVSARAPWACRLALAATSVSGETVGRLYTRFDSGVLGPPFIRHEAHCLLSPSYFQSVYAWLQMNPARQMREGSSSPLVQIHPPLDPS